MFADIAAPIVSLLNSLMEPLLLIVGALGSLYCVILGVKYAKAEEPQVQVQTKMQSQWMRQYIYAVALGMLVIAVILGGFKIIQWRKRRL